MHRPHRLSALAAALLLCAGGAEAAPFQLTFSSVVSGITGDAQGLLAIGDPLSVVVIVDNGGNSALSQTWTTADTQSATATAGGYTATWTSDFFASTGFETDAAGTLINASWFGTEQSPGSVDSFGTGARLLNGNILASNWAQFFFDPSFGGTPTGNPGAWSNPVRVGNDVGVIPLPASLGLLLAALTALFGVAAARRRAA